MNKPTLTHENELREAGHALICGVDEAGRGPLAGPVTAGAVILPRDFSHSILNDSKKMTERQREKVYAEITQHSEIIWSVSIVDAGEIDRVNILQASREAMRRAVQALRIPPDYALVDGLPVPQFPIPHKSLVGGDGLSLSIAAASVIAKVTRDQLMREYAERYPKYGFDIHKGYPTARHLAALAESGPCEIHRFSFGPVAQQTLRFSA